MDMVIDVSLNRFLRTQRFTSFKTKYPTLTEVFLFQVVDQGNMEMHVLED